MTNASEIADESRLESPIDRRTALIKWLVFGVLLPLLPFAARALAAWMDNSTKSLSFNSLLSDGELLVVATVISAAVIGDLIFDFTGINKTREQGAKAVLCAFALVVVVASVLMFGLVTLNNQDRNASFLQAQEEVTTISSGDNQLQAQTVALRIQSTVDSEVVARLTTLIPDVLNQEQEASKGSVRNTLRSVAALLKEQERNASAVIAQDNAQLTLLSRESNQDQTSAQRAFVVSVEDLGLGEKQASYMSIIMFLLSFFVGLCVYLLPWNKTAGDQGTTNKPLEQPTEEA